MSQGIICITDLAAFKDTFDLTIDPALIDLGKLKEALLLPDRYIIERVHKPLYLYRDSAEIIVSSPDIPEWQGETLPTVTPCHCYEHISEDGKTRTVSLSDILINGVSAIKEEDKKRKKVVVIKEVKDVSAIAHEKDETLRLAIALDARLKSLRNLDSSEADAVLSEVQGIVQWWVSDDGLLGGNLSSDKRSTDNTKDKDPREEQFKGFAKLLWKDLEQAIRQDFNGHIPEGKTWRNKCIPAWQKIIARRLYDFLKHAFYELDIWRSGSLDVAVQSIPDLNKWPDEAEYPRTNQ